MGHPNKIQIKNNFANSTCSRSFGTARRLAWAQTSSQRQECRCNFVSLLVFAYFGAARELNFLDIGERGEQDFSRDGAPAQTARWSFVI
jgi:hypothetical protein